MHLYHSYLRFKNSQDISVGDFERTSMLASTPGLGSSNTTGIENSGCKKGSSCQFSHAALSEAGIAIFVARRAAVHASKRAPSDDLLPTQPDYTIKVCIANDAAAADPSAKLASGSSLDEQGSRSIQGKSSSFSDVTTASDVADQRVQISSSTSSAAAVSLIGIALPSRGSCAPSPVGEPVSPTQLEDSQVASSKNRSCTNPEIFSSSMPVSSCTSAGTSNIFGSRIAIFQKKKL
jgi:hypothetical protein